MTRNLLDFPILLAPAESAGGGFALTSPDIAEGATIDRKFVFNDFGGTGDNVSPELRWSEPPAGTRSFALFCDDPDAPTGGAGFWHWLVIDIPADARGLKQGAGTPDGAGLPSGAKPICSDYGFSHWGGPCPPVGDPPHRYVFTLSMRSASRQWRRRRARRPRWSASSSIRMSSPRRASPASTAAELCSRRWRIISRSPRSVSRSRRRSAIRNGCSPHRPSGHLDRGAHRSALRSAHRDDASASPASSRRRRRDRRHRLDRARRRPRVASEPVCSALRHRSARRADLEPRCAAQPRFGHAQRCGRCARPIAAAWPRQRGNRRTRCVAS